MFHHAAQARCSPQLLVGGHERCAQRGDQSDVERVVEARVLGASPRPPWPAHRSSGGDGRPVARRSGAVSRRRRQASCRAGRAVAVRCPPRRRSDAGRGTPQRPAVGASPPLGRNARGGRKSGQTRYCSSFRTCWPKSGKLTRRSRPQAADGSTPRHSAHETCSRTRSRARHRPLVGPMLPIGSPSSSEISA